MRRLTTLVQVWIVVHLKHTTLRVRLLTSRSRQHRATPPVRACTNITLDESGTGQRCGCYLLGPVAAYQSSDRRAKRRPDPILTTLVPPTLQRVFSGWVRTLTDGLAGMRHTVEIVSTRRIRWCQLFVLLQIPVAYSRPVLENCGPTLAWLNRVLCHSTVPNIITTR